MLDLKLNILDSMRFLETFSAKWCTALFAPVVTIFDSFLFEKNACRYSSVLGAIFHVYLQENTPGIV